MWCGVCVFVVTKRKMFLFIIRGTGNGSLIITSVCVVCASLFSTCLVQFGLKKKCFDNFYSVDYVIPFFLLAV